MRIMEVLRETVFKPDFIDRLANTMAGVNSSFLSWQGRESAEPAFLDLLAEEIHRSMPGYRILTHIGIKPIPELPSEARAEKALGISLKDLREKICEGYSNSPCRASKCLEGAYPNGTEIDALVIHEKDFCFIEYEKSRGSLCSDFMKMYRLRRLLNKPFESLFVTRLTTMPQPDGPTTFESFNRNIDSIKEILDALLQNWSILEITNLFGSEGRRQFHWRP